MRCFVFLLGIALVSLAGCAASQYKQARKMLAKEDYVAAEQAFQALLEENPDNVRLLIDLAEVFYHQGELERAETHLNKARSLDPQNSSAIVLIGLIYEKRGDMDKAIAAYRSYSQLSKLGRSRKIIKARLDRLIRERIQVETAKAVAQEEMLDVADIPDNSIAVTLFRNLGSRKDLDPLQKGLAEMMVTDLSKVPGLQVVERLRMQEMMKEIGLSQTGAVDPATAPRLGKLVGASQIVNGSFTDLPEDQLRLDINVSRAKTGEVGTSEASGSMKQLFRLQKQLTFGMVEEMGIELTNEQRDAIQEVPTENMLAFIAYSKGLDLEDQGKPEEAAAAFKEAVKLDDNFAAAQESVERVEAADVAAGDLSAVSGQVLEEEAEAAEDEEGIELVEAVEVQQEEEIEQESETLARLSATGSNVGSGFIATGESSQADVRKPVEEVEESGLATRRIRIKVTLP